MPSTRISEESAVEAIVVAQHLSELLGQRVDVFGRDGACYNWRVPGMDVHEAVRRVREHALSGMDSTLARSVPALSSAVPAGSVFSVRQ